jgi:hypothetical protein
MLPHMLLMLPACLLLPQINAKRDVETSLETQYQRSLKVLHGTAVPNAGILPLLLLQRCCEPAPHPTADNLRPFPPFGFLQAVKRALKKQGNESRLQLIQELIEARGGNFGLDELPSALIGGNGGADSGAGRAVGSQGDDLVSGWCSSSSGVGAPVRAG